MRDAVTESFFDPFDPDVIADPYPFYARLHATTRVHQVTSRDIWVLIRHDDVAEAARAHEVLSSAESVTYQRVRLPMMITSDPPDHTRLRTLVSRDFTPRAVERYRPMVERLVRDLVGELVEHQTADLVEVLAGPLPVMVIAGLLGIPADDHRRFKRWSDDVVEGFKAADQTGPDEGGMSRALDSITELRDYFSGLIAERRRGRGADLISRLIEPVEGDALSDEELFWMCLLLLVAGNETTTNLISNMVVAFADHRAEWALLQRRPDLVPAAVRETLRYDSPFQGFYRTAVRPYVVGDVQIPAGARVLLAYGAANRDPQRYPAPDEFRIERDPRDHLAFAAGIHRCLGARLAEMEAEMVLTELLERTSGLEMDGHAERTNNPTLRGFARLPVRVASGSGPYGT